MTSHTACMNPSLSRSEQSRSEQWMSRDAINDQGACAMHQREATHEDEGISSQQFSQMLKILRTFQGDLDVIRSDLGRIGRDEQILTSLHEERRRFVENFHEQEVIRPICLTLIGLADRCRDDIRRLHQQIKTMPQPAASAVLAVLQKAIEARQADRVDVENQLMSLGVDAYEHHGKSFNPALQKSRIHIPTDDPVLHHTVAERYHPGYRRGKHIFREERVSVYITNNTKEIGHDR